MGFFKRDTQQSRSDMDRAVDGFRRQFQTRGQAPPSRSALEQMVADIRNQIQNRGQAPIAEAQVYTDAYLDRVVARAGLAHVAEARKWMSDRLRLMIVTVPAPQWFQSNLEHLPEHLELKAEWNALVKDLRFGPAYLVAWWWLLWRDVFEGLMAKELQQMEEPLVEGVQGAASGGFVGAFVDWESFFRNTV
jgi:hypothetical protein